MNTAASTSGSCNSLFTRAAKTCMDLQRFMPFHPSASRPKRALLRHHKRGARPLVAVAVAMPDEAASDSRFPSASVMRKEAPATTTTRPPERSVDGNGAQTTSPGNGMIITRREYKYNEEHLGTVGQLHRALQECGVGFGTVAFTSIVLAAIQAQDRLGSSPVKVILGLQVGNVAYWLDSLVLAVLAVLGARSFRRVLEGPAEEHLRHTFEGFTRLALLFQQLAVAALALGVVQGLEAAAKWPQVADIGATIFFSVAGLRLAALSWLVLKPSFKFRSLPAMLYGATQSRGWSIQRLALALVLGQLVFNAPRLPNSESSQESTDEGTAEPEYELQWREEMTLRGCVDGMRTSAVALLLQAFSVFLLSVAGLGVADYGSAAGSAAGAFNKIVMALLVFKASTCFDGALETSGSDITLLMRGIGARKHGGLAALFHRLSILAWSVVVGQTIQIFLPLLIAAPEVSAGSSAVLSGPIAEVVVGVQSAVVEGLLHLVGALSGVAA